MHRTWSRTPGRFACTSACTAILLNLLAPPAAWADHQIGVIEITGDRIEQAESREQGFSPTPGPTPDTAGLLKRMPGADVNRNGGLTGIAQYRGLFGSRVNVRIDGMHINSAGPNAMDPPLSYIPHSQLDRITLIRGIAPVSSGAESLGGTLLVESEDSAFGFSDAFETHGDLELSASSVNEATAVSAGLSQANRRHRMHVRGSLEHGNDIEFDGGQIRPSEHERRSLSLGYGFQHSGHEWSVDLRRNETDESGTPALPMDIIFINSTLANLDYSGRLGGARIDARVYVSDSGHRMDNHSLRPPLNPMMLRQTDADSDGLGFTLGSAWALGPGELALGLDGHLAEHDAVISDPNNPMFRVDSFNAIERDILGLYAEWTARLAPAWDFEAGARVNRTRSDAGAVFHSMAALNNNIATLQNRFNGAGRERTDTNYDWVLELTHHLSEGVSLNLGAARKMRTPSYQERYLWIPLQATAGLADGNNHVGAIGLRPETSHQLELGLDWRGARGHFSPRAFYRDVDDYIQGTPSTDPVVIAISSANGDPTPLQFSNVEARLWGLDADWALELAERWRLHGQFSYVRGERDDIDDDLYRIAPPNATLALTHRRARWSTTLEAVGYARQDKVSETNEETETGGYALLNLAGEYRLDDDTRLLAGVDNLFDRFHREHLAGFNRVRNPDIPLGARLPGPGRNLYVSLSHSW